jgi:hypothetical protein
MLAPVIFISLRCAAVATANALGGSRLERPAAPIDIYSIYFFIAIFFPLSLYKSMQAAVHLFSRPRPP